MIYVGGPDDELFGQRSELRYALRSWDANYRGSLRDVWVVGDVPDWFTGAKMPLPPRARKFENARQSITTYVNHPGAADAVILAMDDIFLIEPVDRLPLIHLGPAKTNSTYADHQTHRADYAVAMRNTTDWLIEHGHPDPLAYIGHTPVHLDTARVRAFLADYPDHLLLEPYMMTVVAGIGLPGRRGGNAKCKSDDNLDHKLSLDIPYLSSNPDTWTGRLGDVIREKYPTPCRWER